MNWPLVSRREHDEATNMLRRLVAAAHSEHDVTLGQMRELREQRDYFAARVEALTTDLLSMRRDGFSAAKPATVHEPPDEEAEGLRRAEAGFVLRAADLEFITKATRDIMQKTGVSESQARAEAIRLRRAVTDEDPPT